MDSIRAGQFTNGYVASNKYFWQYIISTAKNYKYYRRNSKSSWKMNDFKEPWGPQKWQKRLSWHTIREELSCCASKAVFILQRGELHVLPEIKRRTLNSFSFKSDNELHSITLWRSEKRAESISGPQEYVEWREWREQWRDRGASLVLFWQDGNRGEEHSFGDLSCLSHSSECFSYNKKMFESQ